MGFGSPLGHMGAGKKGSWHACRRGLSSCSTMPKETRGVGGIWAPKGDTPSVGEIVGRKATKFARSYPEHGIVKPARSNIHPFLPTCPRRADRQHKGRRARCAARVLGFTLPRSRS